MVNYKERIAEIISSKIDALSLEDAIELLEIPQDSKMGDYAFPCFRLAKVMRKAPQMIAADITESIKGESLFSDVQQVNAYVNFV